jgi:hypothetical protein
MFHFTNAVFTLAILGVIPALFSPLSSFGFARGETDTVKLKKLKEEKLRVAKEAYENVRKKRTDSLEVVYPLSIKFLKSELDLANSEAEKLASYQGHLNRMREVADFCDRLREAESISVDNWLAATYYRLEAEIWRDEFKMKSK